MGVAGMLFLPIGLIGAIRSPSPTRPGHGAAIRRAVASGPQRRYARHTARPSALPGPRRGRPARTTPPRSEAGGPEALPRSGGRRRGTRVAWRRARPCPPRSATTTSASSDSRTRPCSAGCRCGSGRARRRPARARTRSCSLRTDVTARTARAASSTPRPGRASTVQRNDLARGTVAALARRGIAAIAPDLNAAYTGGWGEPNDRARWPRLVNRCSRRSPATPPESRRGSRSRSRDGSTSGGSASSDTP